MDSKQRAMSTVVCRQTQDKGKCFGAKMGFCAVELQKVFVLSCTDWKVSPITLAYNVSVMKHCQCYIFAIGC